MKFFGFVETVRDVAKAITEASVRIAKAIDAHAARTAPQCAAAIWGRSGISPPSWWACTLPRDHKGDHDVEIAGISFEASDHQSSKEATKA